jgi:rubrerythrin
MDLERFTVEDLLLAAMRSEVESEEVYEGLAKRVRNAFLKDKLRFLAKEEVKHLKFLKGVYKRSTNGKRPVIPKESPVPLPLIILGDEATTPVSKVLESAMGAEKAANEFYNTLAERFDDADTRNKVKYLASMELGHFRLLEIEAEEMRRYEDHLEEWPMMHTGP